MKQETSSNYFKLLSFSILVSIVAYGFTLTNFSLSIDSEQVFYPDTSLSLGRWGTNLVRYHIFKGIIPYFTLLLSLILLSVTAVELTKLFRLKNALGYIFCGLFLTFPQMAYQLIFTMQADAVALGFLSSVLAVKFFLKSREIYFSIKAVAFFIIASLLFMFTIAIYQALCFLPITIYAIVLFQNTYRDKEYNLKKEFKNIAFFILLTIVSVILYFISVKIFCPNGNGSGFLASYNQGGYNNIFSDFFKLLFTNFKGNAYYGEKTFFIAGIASILIVISFLFKQKKLLAIRLLLLVCIIIIPFLISFFIASSYNPPRLYVASGIVFAFIIVHLISIIKLEKTHLILSSIIVLANIYFITMLFWSHSKVYNHDINIARNIDLGIRIKYPEFNPNEDYVYFFGSVPYSEHEKFRLPDSEIFGGSFFVWDEGSNDRIINFMKFSNVAHYRKIDNKETYLKIKDSIESMPTWPKKDYIKRVDNVIIVKLGDTKGARLWVE